MSVLSRVAALVAAVALVVAAVAVRAAREDGGDPDGAGSGLLGGSPVAGSCVGELRDLCRRSVPTGEVDWTFSPAAVTAADLEGSEPLAVVLPAAWADVADDARARAGQPPLSRSDVVARTPLLMVAFEDRASVLAEACGLEVAELDWACVGEHAGTPWPGRRLEQIGRRVEDGVAEVDRIARHGSRLDRAIRELEDPDELRARLAAARSDPATPEEVTEALGSQLGSTERIVRLAVETRQRLEVLDAHLDEAVARVVELSLRQGDAEEAAPLGSRVDGLVGEMESLRLALDESDTATG